MIKNFIFDLDGTLIDSASGETKKAAACCLLKNKGNQLLIWIKK